MVAWNWAWITSWWSYIPNVNFDHYWCFFPTDEDPLHYSQWSGIAYISPLVSEQGFSSHSFPVTRRQKYLHWISDFILFFLFFSSERLKGFQVFSYYIYGKNYLYMHRQSVQGKKMKNPILLQWMITPSASNYTDKNPPPPPSQCFLYLVCKTYTCVHLYAHQNRSELKQFLFMWPRPGRDDAYF